MRVTTTKRKGRQRVARIAPHEVSKLEATSAPSTPV
jgi:hypothetical protein